MRSIALSALLLLECAAVAPKPCDVDAVAARAAAITAECEALCAPLPVKACAALNSCLDRLDQLEASCRGR